MVSCTGVRFLLALQSRFFFCFFGFERNLFWILIPSLSCSLFTLLDLSYYLSLFLYLVTTSFTSLLFFYCNTTFPISLFFFLLSIVRSLSTYLPFFLPLTSSIYTGVSLSLKCQLTPLSCCTAITKWSKASPFLSSAHISCSGHSFSLACLNHTPDMCMRKKNIISMFTIILDVQFMSGCVHKIF